MQISIKASLSLDSMDGFTVFNEILLAICLQWIPGVLILKDFIVYRVLDCKWMLEVFCKKACTAPQYILIHDLSVILQFRQAHAFS